MILVIIELSTYRLLQLGIPQALQISVKYRITHCFWHTPYHVWTEFFLEIGTLALIILPSTLSLTPTLTLQNPISYLFLLLQLRGF